MYSFDCRIRIVSCPVPALDEVGKDWISNINHMGCGFVVKLSDFYGIVAEEDDPLENPK